MKMSETDDNDKYTRLNNYMINNNGKIIKDRRGSTRVKGEMDISIHTIYGPKVVKMVDVSMTGFKMMSDMKKFPPVINVIINKLDFTSKAEKIWNDGIYSGWKWVFDKKNAEKIKNFERR